MENEPKPSNEIPMMVILSTERATLGVVSIFDNIAAIKAIKIGKDKLTTMPPDWRVGCGFYILVSDISEGRFNAYVGKATQNNFYARLSSHRRDKENWDYAFLFQRDTSNGLNSTQASYIEGELYAMIQETDEISVINSQTAGDKTLALHEVFYMNQVVSSALQIMGIFGYKLEKTTSFEALSKTYYGVSFKQLIDSGSIAAGETLRSTLPQTSSIATVGHKGVVYQGEELSVSASAIKAVLTEETGRKSANGWMFWAVERDDALISLFEIREGYIAQKKLSDSALPSKISDETKPSQLKDPQRHKDSTVKIFELVDAGLIEDDMRLISIHPDYPAAATIEFDAIKISNKHYQSVNDAAKSIVGLNAPGTNGWEFWGIVSHDDTIVSFNEILDEFIEYKS